MRLWDRFVLLVFPGSLEEYRESRKIHVGEIRRYRKQPQYVAGVCLFFVPLLYLMVSSIHREDWLTVGLLVCIMFGEICIRDSLSEHYCLLLYRLGYEPPTQVEQEKAASADEFRES